MYLANEGMPSKRSSRQVREPESGVDAWALRLPQPTREIWRVSFPGQTFYRGGMLCVHYLVDHGHFPA